MSARNRGKQRRPILKRKNKMKPEEYNLNHQALELLAEVAGYIYIGSTDKFNLFKNKYSQKTIRIRIVPKQNKKRSLISYKESQAFEWQPHINVEQALEALEGYYDYKNDIPTFNFSCMYHDAPILGLWLEDCEPNGVADGDGFGWGLNRIMCEAICKAILKKENE